MHPFILYAQEVNRDRERRMNQLAILAEERRALRHSSAMTDSRSLGIRRSIALAMAFLSRSTASFARRLDECVADDLGRSLAPTE